MRFGAVAILGSGVIAVLLALAWWWMRMLPSPYEFSGWWPGHRFKRPKSPERH